MSNIYEPYCRVLLNSGSRFIYTTHKIIGATLEKLKTEYPSFHTEIPINEKVAYELALTGSIAGKRNTCMFSAERVYEALDPIMSSAYTGVIGGLLIIGIRDTVEEVTPLGLFSKMPLFVTETLDDFTRAVTSGYTISEKYEIPVIIQVTPEESPATGHQPPVTSHHSPPTTHEARFVRNPARWAATPQFRFSLHKELNDKLNNIREDLETYEGNKKVIKGKRGVITTRMVYSSFPDGDESILTLSTVHPLPRKLVSSFISEVDTFYIVEGEYPVIELQIGDREKLIKEPFFAGHSKEKHEETMYGFYVVRDILGPASSINMAHGIKRSSPEKKLLAITFEDAFFHSGMPAFINTLYNNSSYLLLIMTNKRAQEIENLLKGWGFTNIFYLKDVNEIERFKDSDEMTVVFYKGMV